MRPAIFIELPGLNFDIGSDFVVVAGHADDARHVVVGCLAVTGLATIVSGAVASLGTQADVVSVERSHKGDRLQLAPKNTSTVPSPVVTTLSRPPIGCEPAFSRVADPRRSHVFGRCIS